MKKIGVIVFLLAMGFVSFAQSEYVDLGLPSGTYWKKENVGGDSYVFRNSNYYYTYQDALKKFGNKLPTKEQYEELLKYCKWERNLNDNDNGYKVIGPNGNYIILERVGYRTMAGIVTDVEWHAVRLVLSKDEARRIRLIEREQKRVSDSISREWKRVSDSIAIERKRISDSIAKEEELRKQEQLEQQRLQEKEMIESLYGQWTGVGEIAKIQIFVKENHIIMYDKGGKVYEGPVEITVKNGRVQFYNERVNYLGEGYTRAYLGGAACQFRVMYNGLSYDNELNCFIINSKSDCINCQYGYSKNETLYLKKTIEKKKKDKKRKDKK